jgi:hypothetical protein
LTALSISTEAYWLSAERAISCRLAKTKRARGGFADAAVAASTPGEKLLASMATTSCPSSVALMTLGHGGDDADGNTALIVLPATAAIFTWLASART